MKDVHARSYYVLMLISLTLSAVILDLETHFVTCRKHCQNKEVKYFRKLVDVCMLFSLFCWIAGSKDGKTAFLACGTRQVLALDGKKATSGEKQRDFD